VLLLKAAILANELYDAIIILARDSRNQAVVRPHPKQELLATTSEARKFGEAPLKRLFGVLNFFLPGFPEDKHRRPQITFANATAVSAMRFENPHSLSYHERMRTNVPSITLVWSRWNTEEWLSWLKSAETLGLSV
jgi:hypothetical protein